MTPRYAGLPDPRATLHSPDDGPAGGRETRLRRAIRQIMQADDFPALTRELAEIIAGLGTGEHSAQRIATIVLRDYSLTIKVVRAANSAHYRRGHHPIRSVTQAMMVLGVDAVRRLAASLLFLEHYRRHAAGLKELLLLSLITANHARDAAHRTGTADPETAYLCGMMRNIGEVLVACHFPAAYTGVLREAAQEVQARASRSSTGRSMLEVGDVASATRRASVAVLGFTFEDLGDAVLEQWGMPLEIRQALNATGAPTDTALQRVAAFAHELTTAVYRAENVAEAIGLPWSAAAVLRRHGARLGLVREALAELLATAVEETRDLFADVGMSLDELRLTKQTAAALADLGLSAEEFPVRSPASDGSSEPGGEAGDASRLAALAALRERLLTDVAATAAPAVHHELHTVLAMALEACLIGAPADRAGFCLLAPDRSVLEARLTVGVSSDRLAARFPIPVRELTSPLVRALDQRREVTIEDTPAASAAAKRWLRGAGASRATIMPLVVNGVAIGALYVDLLESPDRGAAITGAGLRSVPAGEAAEQRTFLEGIRQVALDAIGLRRDAPPAAVPAPAAVPRATAEARRDLVLRVLRGEAIADVASSAGVDPAELTEWHTEFLAGAVAALERGQGG